MAALKGKRIARESDKHTRGMKAGLRGVSTWLLRMPSRTIITQGNKLALLGAEFGPVYSIYWPTLEF